MNLAKAQTCGELTSRQRSQGGKPQKISLPVSQCEPRTMKRATPRIFTAGDPFLSSLMARASVHRLAAVAMLIVCLWLAISWAVSLP
jgi:hypothetical protein